MKRNYLNNKDILKEIHRSKTTYCCFPNKEDNAYDMILPDVSKINKKNILLARENRAERLAKLAHDAATADGVKRKLDEFEIKLKDVADTDVVFRVMTWDHIPIDDAKSRKAAIKAYEEEEGSILRPEYDDAELDIQGNTKYVKVNFPPFKHYKIDAEDEPICVGISHWKGALEIGHFSRDHGNMTPKLAHMFMKLCERYATRSNWRGYCVDTGTEAMTQRGWLNTDQINESDTILSYAGGELKWSSIKSIYRGQYDGLMHCITSRSIDSLMTPSHKLVTVRGLVEVELVKQSDQVIIMGEAVPAPTDRAYTDSFVELAGRVMIDGCYQFGQDEKIKSIQIYQNSIGGAARLRRCLNAEGYKFTESGDTNLCFSIWKEYAKKFTSIFPVKNLSMEFILQLTHDQRELLINTMVNGDGQHRVGNNMSYCQKDKEHVDIFQALLTLAGKKSNYHYVTDHPSFGKSVNFYSINIFSKRGNTIRGACLNFNGGLNNGVGINKNQGKAAFPNIPTVPYYGMVWCPETEYGCFVARRNGKVYLTGNTYNDEMRAQALLQLSQIGLQFDEAKSDNPFAYYTAAITNSFTRVLNIEKRNQNLRDDILEMNSRLPSFTRQNQGSGTNVTYDGGYDE